MSDSELERKAITEPEIGPDVHIPSAADLMNPEEPKKSDGPEPVEISKAKDDLADIELEARDARNQVSGIPTISKEVCQRCTTLKRKLRLYTQLFSHVVGDVYTPYMAVFDVQQLEDATSEAQWAVSVHNSADQYREGVLFGSMAFEHVGTNYCGFQLTGMTKSLNMSSRFHGVMNEILIEGSDSLYISPFKRMGLLIGSAAMSSHAMNTNPDLMAAAQAVKDDVAKVRNETVGNPPAVAPQTRIEAVVTSPAPKQARRRNRHEMVDDEADL